VIFWGVAGKVFHAGWCFPQPLCVRVWTHRVGKDETIRTVPSGDEEATGINGGAKTDARDENTDLLKSSTKITWADVVKGRGVTENKGLVL
jgi:hypothetical protein